MMLALWGIEKLERTVLVCFDTRRDEEKETQHINVVGKKSDLVVQTSRLVQMVQLVELFHIGQGLRGPFFSRGLQNVDFHETLRFPIENVQNRSQDGTKIGLRSPQDGLKTFLKCDRF